LCRKILDLEEELKIVGNHLKSLEISEQEVSRLIYGGFFKYKIVQVTDDKELANQVIT